MSPVEKQQYPNNDKMLDNARWPSDIPRIPFAELTPEQQRRIVDIYRFSGFRPGQYQGPIKPLGQY